MEGALLWPLFESLSSSFLVTVKQVAVTSGIPLYTWGNSGGLMLLLERRVQLRFPLYFSDTLLERFICVMWDQAAGFGFCHSVRMSCNDIGKLQLIWIHDMVQAGIRVKIKGCTAKHCSRTTSIAWTVLVKQDTWWSPLKAFCYMEKSLSYSGPVRGFLK